MTLNIVTSKEEININRNSQVRILYVVRLFRKMTVSMSIKEAT